LCALILVTLFNTPVHAQFSSSLTLSAVSGTFGGTVSLQATYGNGPLNALPVSFTLNGAAVGSATFVNGVATLPNVSLAGINAGSYPAGIGASAPAISSFPASSGTASLTVAPARPSLSVSGFTGTYDGSPHGATCTVSLTVNVDDRLAPRTSGRKTADFPPNVSAGACVFSYDSAPVNAGSYNVEAMWISNNPNFTNGFGESMITITPANLTVAASNVAKTYGAPLPALPTTVIGLVGGDTASVISGTPVVSTLATASSPVGSYVIAVTGKLGANNYAVRLAPGTLAISPAVLTVTASGGTPSYGTPNTLTYSVSGFVNGDTAAVLSGAPVLSTAASQNSSPGNYAVTATLGTLSAPNYTFAFQPGSLTITKIATDLGLSGITPGASASVGQTFTLSFVMAAASGAALPTGSVVYSVDGGPSQSAPLSGGHATVAFSSLPIGVHQVVSNYSGDSNYQASTPHSLTLSVNALSTQLTLSAAPGMKAPSGQPIVLTFCLIGTPAPSGNIVYAIDGGASQASPFSNGDVIVSLSGLAMGSHVLAYSYGGDSNYPAIATRTANLTVTTPLPVLTTVVNAADFGVKISAGGLATIFGTGLATVTASAPSLPLPITLEGSQVFINGASAPITFVSTEQINLQIPIGTLVGTPVQVAVVLNGVSSLPVMVTFSTTAPAVFAYDRVPASTDPIIVHTDNSLVTPTAPAQAGEILTIYATGAGTLNNAPLDGQPAPSSPDATTKATPSVLVGTAAASVQFSGLTPGSVGLLQINIQLPATLQTGTGTPHSLPLVIGFPGASSTPVNLWVP
jgi:uncharacterized protein (TIGR03437 family)